MRIPVTPNATEAITAVGANLARTGAGSETGVIGGTNRQGWPAIDRAAGAAAKPRSAAVPASQRQQARAATSAARRVRLAR
jgi:hypothetical protein